MQAVDWVLLVILVASSGVALAQPDERPPWTLGARLFTITTQTALAVWLITTRN